MKAILLCRQTLCIFCGLVLIIVLAPNLVWGQETARSFDELKQKLSIGDTVQVINSNGKKTQGRLAEISPSSLILTADQSRLVLSENSIREVKKRRHDPWWNGSLIGSGIGAAAGFLIARSHCSSDDSECLAISYLVFVGPGIGIGATAGALIDRSISRFDTVFTGAGSSTRARIRFSPILSRQQKGFNLSVSF